MGNHNIKEHGTQHGWGLLRSIEKTEAGYLKHSVSFISKGAGEGNDIIRSNRANALLKNR